MTGQFGFAGVYACYSQRVFRFQSKSICSFRNAFQRCFYEDSQPSTISLHRQGIVVASLPNHRSEQVDWMFKEQASQYWFGLAAAFLVLFPETANASSLDVLQDMFKSKPLSLVHPLVMLGVLGTSLYTFYLGYQSRRIREADSETRKQLVKGRYGQRHYQISSILLAVLTFFTFEGMVKMSLWLKIGCHGVF